MELGELLLSLEMSSSSNSDFLTKFRDIWDGI